MRKTIILLFCAMFSSFTGFGNSEGESEKQLYKEGVIAFETGDYNTAKSKFIELIKIDVSNAEYHFLAGLAIYKTESSSDNAIKYLEEATKHFKNDTIAEVYYYLGQMYHYDEKYEESLSYYNQFLKHTKKNKAGTILTSTVKNEMQWVENAKKHALTGEANVISGRIEVKNMGENINSAWGDYAPYKVNDQLLAFTSRRPNGNPEYAVDGKPYEDIYFATKKENWAVESNVDKKVIYPAYNTLMHDAFISMNEDAKTIYIYRKNGIYASTFAEGKWSQLIEVDRVNNNSKHTPSVALSPDGKTMYFSNEQSNGFGGKDIYVTKLNESGNWSKPENLGEKINTKSDDDGPFITPDGKTLYFSTEGRESCGGFDLYKIDLSDPAASAVRLPMPFNTVANDIFIITNNEGNEGYFSSSRNGGVGGMDLYEFTVKPHVDSNLVVISTLTDIKDSAENAILISYSKDALFQKNFGYNQNTIEKSDAGFSEWMNGVEKLAVSKQKLIVHIESSASKVPTSTYANNKKLAALRGQNAKIALENILKENGFDMNDVKITVSSGVNGPDYKGDYENGQSIYAPFQYVKVTVKVEKGS